MNPRKLRPEEKVNLSINMTDTCVQICADAVKSKNEIIEEEELIEKVRARIMHQKRRHKEV